MVPLRIKGLEIGCGVPKTIVSVMDAQPEGACATIEKGKTAGVDCFEWRADFAADMHDAQKMIEFGHMIAGTLPDNPLLFTFRSASQGGRTTLSIDEYASLNRALIESEAIDMVDIETWIGDECVRELVDCAHENDVRAIVSYHDFAGTPSQEWIVDLLAHMQDLGADIPKIAVMANDAHDTLTLLSATEEMARTRAETPLLTMAMGRDGSITRLAGECFGSALTFCSLEAASAPGQVDVRTAKRIMMELHGIISPER